MAVGNPLWRLMLHGAMEVDGSFEKPTPEAFFDCLERSLLNQQKCVPDILRPENTPKQLAGECYAKSHALNPQHLTTKVHDLPILPVAKTVIIGEIRRRILFLVLKWFSTGC